MTNTVPIWEKANLSLEEATAYYGIEEDTLSQIISVEECQPYILTIGNKQLIRRKAFEKYLSETYSAGTCHNEDAVLESAAQDLDNCMTEPDYTLSDGVEYKTLSDVVRVERGKRVVRDQLPENGKYYVYQNALAPLGYINEFNFKGNTTFVIGAGAAGEISVHPG